MSFFLQFIIYEIDFSLVNNYKKKKNDTKKKDIFYMFCSLFVLFENTNSV